VAGLGWPLMDGVYGNGDKMSRPSHIVDYLMRIYLDLLERNPQAKLVIAFDYLGYTPKIESILRNCTSQRAIVWPKQADSLFDGNEPLQNTITEIFADDRARWLLLQYISQHAQAHHTRRKVPARRLHHALRCRQ